MRFVFRDRVEAGQCLANQLSSYARRDDVIVLALPRGGVPVGFEVACRLRVPLDVLLVRKLAVPGREDEAMGVVGLNGAILADEHVLHEYQVSQDELDIVACLARLDLERRSQIYRGTRAAPILEDRIVLLVDDGIATGATMEVAIQLVRPSSPRSVIVAAPVIAEPAARRLARVANDVIGAHVHAEERAIAGFYGEFLPTSDDEVIALLTRAAVRFRRGLKTAPELHCTRLPASPFLGLANHRMATLDPQE